MDSMFKAVFSDTKWSDDFYRFLQVIFHLYPEDKFHHLIASTTKEKQGDEAIYRAVQQGLPGIKPFLSELTYALPALKKQKKEMAAQVLRLLVDRRKIDGYLEIGSTGRYISELKKHIALSGGLYLTHDIAPSNSPADIMERGQLGRVGEFHPLTYQPIPESILPESLDLVYCPIGLHHCPKDLLDGYIRSFRRVLRKGGRFILRDHDVKTPEMHTFVSLVHCVFNLGLNTPWETDKTELRLFRPVSEWISILGRHGFRDSSERILQDKDPSDNTLLLFTKA